MKIKNPHSENKKKNIFLFFFFFDRKKKKIFMKIKNLPQRRRTRISGTDTQAAP